MVSSNNHSSYTYKIGGTLEASEPSYVIREADKELFEKLKNGDFCYVLNSRQMGKSSLGIRVQHKLESEKIVTAYIDLQDIGRARDWEWYEGIIYILADELSSYLQFDWESWLEKIEALSPVQKLGQFIEKVLLESIDNKTKRIVIFIDEIDYVQNLEFDTDGFFTLIRSCYNSRARKPQYKSLTFCLLGVATPSDLIKEKQLTPFNIGSAITLKGFTLDEVNPLIKGLTTQVNEPKKVMEKILYWTGGQPFLTQRLCDLVVNQKLLNPNLTEIVQQNIIENWDAPEQDKQEHLRTIINRILSDETRADLLLKLYQNILKKGKVTVTNTQEERELQLSGLVVKKGNVLQVYNPIYARVFNETWIDSELRKLRPYSESYRAWLQSGKTDSSRLLRGQALVEAEKWASGKNLGGEDRDFLGASRAKQREAEAKRKAIFLGSIILGIALSLSAVFGILAVRAKQELQQAKIELAKIEKYIVPTQQLNELAQQLEGAEKQEISNLIEQLYCERVKTQLLPQSHLDFGEKGNLLA